MAGRFNTLPAWFANTRSGRAAILEAQEEVTRTRAETVEEIGRIREEARATLGALDARIGKLRPQVMEAAAAHKALLDELRGLEIEAHNVRMGREHEIGAMERQLRESADPLIQEFQRQVEAEWARTRKIAPEVAFYGHPNIHGLQPQVSNQTSLAERLAGLRQAIVEAEALKLDPVEGDELRARLDEIHASVPPIRPASDFLPNGARPATLPTDDPEPKPIRNGWARFGSAGVTR